MLTRFFAFIFQKPLIWLVLFNGEVKLTMGTATPWGISTHVYWFTRIGHCLCYYGSTTLTGPAYVHGWTYANNRRSKYDIAFHKANQPDPEVLLEDNVAHVDFGKKEE